MTISMSKKTILTVTLSCVWFSQLAYAHPNSEFKEINQLCHNETIISAVAEYLHMNDFSYRRVDGNGRIISGVCKEASNDKSITIAAFVGGSGTGDSGELSIAMVDNQTSKVIASYQESLVNSQTPQINAEKDRIQIDTARYDIAPGVRAFGLDVIKTSPDCGEGEISTVRTLFIKDGDKIRPIFVDGLPISSRRFVQSDPRCLRGKYATKKSRLVMEYVVLTIGIDKQITNGYANLLISASILNGNGTKSKRKPFRYELHYYNIDYEGRDIGFYPIDDMSEALKAWQNDFSGGSGR